MPFRQLEINDAQILFAAAGIAALTAAGLAVAQERGPAMAPFQFDANNDGVLTRQEFDDRACRTVHRNGRQP